MKKFLSIFAGLPAFLLLTMSTACSREYVQPGEVGVLVFLHGGAKGVDHEVVGPGRYYVGMNTMFYHYPTYLQNYNYTRSVNEGKAVDESFNFQDKQGMVVNSDIGISYQFMPDRIDFLFTKFHKGPEEMTNVFLRSMIRDSLNRAASTRDISDIYGANKGKFMDEVQSTVQKDATNYGIKVDRVFFPNELRLPSSIAQALNDKVQATQRAQQAENELKITQAEVAKKVAWAEGGAKAAIAEAAGRAAANQKMTATLTPILIQQQWIEKWNGQLPSVQGGNTPIIQIPGR
jgi:regulator of protease activity HflC (stomatin/prohibitin superfamily)